MQAKLGHMCTIDSKIHQIIFTRLEGGYSQTVIPPGTPTLVRLTVFEPPRCDW